MTGNRGPWDAENQIALLIIKILWCFEAWIRYLKLRCWILFMLPLYSRNLPLKRAMGHQGWTVDFNRVFCACMPSISSSLINRAVKVSHPDLIAVSHNAIDADNSDFFEIRSISILQVHFHRELRTGVHESICSPSIVYARFGSKQGDRGGPSASFHFQCQIRENYLKAVPLVNFLNPSLSPLLC